MFPVRISEDQIEKAEAATKQRVAAGYGSLGFLDQPRALKYLTVLEKTASPEVARIAIDATVGEIKHWRREDHMFAVRFNDVLDCLGEKLLGNVMQRAMGNYQTDENTESGLVEDGLGVPIVFGGSDKLALTLLSAFYGKDRIEGVEDVTVKQRPKLNVVLAAPAVANTKQSNVEALPSPNPKGDGE